MWKQLSKKMHRIAPQYPHRTLIPTTENLREFEERFSFIFPQSYISFIETIGIGEINRSIWILGPIKDNSEFDLVRWTRNVRSNATLVAIYKEPELIAGVIPFANTIEGDIFGWDSRRRFGKEYEIICLPRHRKRVKQVCRSFKQFISEICMESAVSVTTVPAKKKAQKQIEFRPFARRIRS